MLNPVSAEGAVEFLIEVIDPQRLSLEYTYDASFRLIVVEDALGWVVSLKSPYKGFGKIEIDAEGSDAMLAPGFHLTTEDIVCGLRVRTRVLHRINRFDRRRILLSC